MTPSDRFLVLSHLVDELPAGAVDAELVRVVSSACFAVVRNLQGRATDAEARFAVDRARAALLEAGAGAAVPTPRVASIPGVVVGDRERPAEALAGFLEDVAAAFPLIVGRPR